MRNFQTMPMKIIPVTENSRQKPKEKKRTDTHKKKCLEPQDLFLQFKALCFSFREEKRVGGRQGKNTKWLGAE